MIRIVIVRRLTQINSVAVPLILIVSANTYRLWNEHWEHVAHEAPPEEKPQYQYLNIRSKAYPWGNGDKVSFHPLSWLCAPVHVTRSNETAPDSSDAVLERQGQLSQD